MPKKIYVGMSGGVDSSVSAALLLKQGFDVTGVYMKNWSKNLPGHYCSWEEDYMDAKKVAAQLGIKFKLYDFEKEYRSQVVDYMVSEYQAGRTPNPDIMCNQEIKFKLFLNTALSDGAELIATGHYARINDGQLLTGLDSNKDQSYFLYRVEESALEKSLMPVGELEKPEVRKIAEKLGLSTANKKDSQGICFVGQVGIKEFLESELGISKPGRIINQTGEDIGEHEGALYYTIGQRHGLNVGGGLPYYVTGKNITRNQVFVTTDITDISLWKSSLKLSNIHWINKPPSKDSKYKIRTRYRADLINITNINHQGDVYTIDLEDEVRAVTPGQSAVIYEKDRVVGGGIVI